VTPFPRHRHPVPPALRGTLLVAVVLAGLCVSLIASAGETGAVSDSVVSNLWRWSSPPLEAEPPWTPLELGFPRRMLPLDREAASFLRRGVSFERGRVEEVFSFKGASVALPRLYSLGDFAGRVTVRNLRRFWEEKTAGGRFSTEGVRTKKGLLHIDIPVQFPKPVEAIIGQGANLDVTGNEKISFGGTSQWVVDEVERERGKSSRFPQLEMKQDFSVRMGGTIGEKVHVEMDQSSMATTPLANRVKLWYEGYEDEIISRIDVGNTNLSLPGTKYVSYGGRHQGLFGLKTKGRLGDIDFTMIASKEEGKSERSSFKGTSRTQRVVLADKDYARRKYYFLNHPYMRPDSISLNTLKVYRDDRIATNNESSPNFVGGGYAYLDPRDTTSAKIQGDFDILEENKDYVVARTYGDRFPVLVLTRTLGPDEVLAAYYKYSAGGALREMGSDDVAEGLRLKVLKVPTIDLPIDESGRYDPTATWATTRFYELKNVYELGSGRIDPQTLQLKITRRAASGQDDDKLDGINYLQILGLDRISRTGEEIPDDQVDLNFFDSANGVLWMPDLRPFAPDSMELFADPYAGRPLILSGENANPDIYDFKTMQPQYVKYNLTFEFSSPQTTIRLGRFDILEGSEIVTANGRRLKRGVDYTISYELGRIELISDRARDPDANIEVSYSYVPLFGAAQKSLLGVSATYSPGESKDKTLSTTWLYESKGAREERPKLGEEPSRNVMGDLHGTYSASSRFVTSLVDALPIISTDKPSRLKVSGEVALSIPNPNTSRLVYVDDMEATEDATTIAVSRRKWQFSSIPIGVPARVGLRGRFNWFNPWNVVHEGDLSPDLPDLERDDQRTVLEIRAEAGDDPDFAAEGWVGLSQLISRSGLDFTRMQYLEIWVNDFREGRNEGWKLKIDLGSVSEDAMWDPDSLPNGRLDTEDRIFPDGVLDEGEDTGLDGLFSKDEPGYSSSNRDPNHDDYGYSRETNPDDYSKINGYENNFLLDTEDLDENGYLDETNSYYEFTVDLASEKYVAVDVYDAYKSRYPDRVKEDNGWRLIRIPLGDRDTAVGTPQWDAIRTARIWLTGFSGRARLQIATIRVVGNRWQKMVLRDSLDRPLPQSEILPGEEFRAATVNNKENRDVYDPPIRVKERSGLEDREQSLSLSFSNLGPGHSGVAFRPYVKDRDFTYYETMELFLSAPDSIAKSLDFFVRVGADSMNYYEYRMNTRRELPPGVARRWEKVQIQLRDFTTVKLLEPDSLGFRRTVLSERASIAALGNPSLTKVRFMALGVANADTAAALSGEVWVDELVLANVRRDVGTAKNLSLSANLADLANVSFSYTDLDKHFVSLGRTAWRGRDETSYSVSAGFNPHRFVPWLGLAFPVSATYSQQKSIPEFRSGTDIFLTPERRELETTLKKTYAYQVSVARASKSGNVLLKHTLDAMKAGLAVSQSSGMSPSAKDTARSVKVTWGYNTSLPKAAGIPLIRGQKLYLLPSNLSFNLTGQAKRSFVYLRDRKDLTIFYAPTRRYEKTMNTNFNTQFRPISMISLGYSGSTSRDLLRDLDAKFLRFLPGGKVVSRGRNLSLGFNPHFGRWFRPNINVRARYQENNLAANRAALNAAEDVRSVGNSLTQTAKWTIPVGQLLGRGAGPARKDTLQPRFSPLEFARGALALVGKFKAVDVSLSKNYRSSYSRIFGIPSLEYRMGLSPSLGEEASLANGSSVSRNSGWRASANSRAELARSLSLTGQFSVEEKTQRSHSGQTTTRSKSWPSVKVETRELERYLPIESFAKSLSLNTSYTHRSDKSVLTQGERRGDKYDFSPFIGVETVLNNGMSVRFSSSLTKQVQVTEFGTTNTVETRSGKHSLTVSKTIEGSKGIKLPFSSKAHKLKSNLNITAGVDYSNSLRKTQSGNRKPTVNSHSDSFALKASAAYSFSANLNGGMSLNFTQRRNIKTNRTMRSLGLSFSASFTF